MTDFLIYSTSQDVRPIGGVRQPAERNQFLYDTTTGESLELTGLPGLSLIEGAIPNENVVLRTYGLDGSGPGGLAYWDLRTGALEPFGRPETDAEPIPLDDGYFADFEEPYFFRPGEGLRLLGDLNRDGSQSPFSAPFDAVPFRDGVLFQADDGTSFDIYFQGDPDEGGPVRLRGSAFQDRENFSYGADLAGGIEVDGRFVFEGDGFEGLEVFPAIYGTDGTPGSVAPLVDAITYRQLVDASAFDLFGGDAYLTLRLGPASSSPGYSVWRTDGTPGGTERVASVEELAAVSPLAGLEPETGGIRANSVLSDPVRVGDKLYVVMLADTVTPREGGGQTVNPLRPLIFEIGADGGPRFASETEAVVNRDLSLDNLTFGTLVAGDRILLPGPNAERLAVDPETGAWEEAFPSFRTLRDGVLERPYGEDGIILLEVSTLNKLIVSDGTAEGTVDVNELLGLFTIDRNYLFVTGDSVAIRTIDTIFATDDVYRGFDTVVDASVNAPARPDNFTPFGIFDGPDDLFETLLARYGAAGEPDGSGAPDDGPNTPDDDGPRGPGGEDGEGRDGPGGGSGSEGEGGGAAPDGLRLDGTPGADRLIGGEGDDVIVGGGGLDVVTGRAGADLFVLFGAGRPAGMLIDDFSGARGDGDRLLIDDRYLGLGDAGFDLRALAARDAFGLLADGTARLNGGLLTFDTDGDGRPEAGFLFEGGDGPGIGDVLLF